MLPRKSVSIPHAAKFDSTLRIKTRNNKHDLLVGFMSGDDNSNAIYLAKMAEPGISRNSLRRLSGYLHNDGVPWHHRWQIRTIQDRAFQTRV